VIIGGAMKDEDGNITGRNVPTPGTKRLTYAGTTSRSDEKGAKATTAPTRGSRPVHSRDVAAPALLLRTNAVQNEDHPTRSRGRLDERDRERGGGRTDGNTQLAWLRGRHAARAVGSIHDRVRTDRLEDKDASDAQCQQHAERHRRALEHRASLA
jgi:hypothetical protein